MRSRRFGMLSWDEYDDYRTRPFLQHNYRAFLALVFSAMTGLSTCWALYVLYKMHIALQSARILRSDPLPLRRSCIISYNNIVLVALVTNCLFRTGTMALIDFRLLDIPLFKQLPY